MPKTMEEWERHLNRVGGALRKMIEDGSLARLVDAMEAEMAASFGLGEALEQAAKPAQETSWRDRPPLL